MASYQIDAGGSSYKIDVDDSLPADQQQQAVLNAAQTIGQQHGGAQPAAPAPENDSLLSPLGAGVGGVLGGLGKSANLAAAGLDAIGLGGGDTARSAGSFLQGAGKAITPANYHSPDPVEQLQQGHYGKAAYEALRGGVEAAPMIAGAIAQPELAAGVAGASALGDTAYQRAQNDGNPGTPTGSEVLGALPTAALNAGAMMIPGGKLTSGIENGLLRKGAQVGADAAMGGGMSAASQVGGSLGTTAGLQFDPAQAADAAVGTGAAGAAHGAVGAARDAAVGGIQKAITPSLDPAEAPARQMALDAYDRSAQAAKNTGGDTSPFAIANNAKSEIATNMSRAIGEIRANGFMDTGDVQTARAVLNQALRHNNTIGTGNDEFSTIFDDLKAQDVPAALLDPIVQGAQALNALSGESFQKNGQGPLRTVGGKLGNLVGHGAGGAVGIPFGGITGAILGASPGGYVGKRIGASIGGRLDSALGLNTPTLVAQRAALAKAVQGQPAPDYQTALSNIANGRLPTSPEIAPGMTPDPETGLAPTAPPPAAPPPPPAPQRPVTAPMPLPGLRIDTPADVAHAVASEGPPAPIEPPPVGVGLPEPAQAPESLLGPQGAPQSPAHSYIDYGAGHSTADINAAAQKAAEIGLITQKAAEALGSGSLNIDGTSADHRGFAEAVRSQLPAREGAQPTRGPIRDPARYDRAAQNDIDLAERQAQAATAAGQPVAAAAVRAVQAAKFEHEKRLIRSTHLSRHPNHAGYFRGLRKGI